MMNAERHGLFPPKNSNLINDEEPQFFTVETDDNVPDVQCEQKPKDTCEQKIKMIRNTLAYVSVDLDKSLVKKHMLPKIQDTLQNLVYKMQALSDPDLQKLQPMKATLTVAPN